MEDRDEDRVVFYLWTGVTDTYNTPFPVIVDSAVRYPPLRLSVVDLSGC